jgi:hypothetical protein
MPASAIHRGSGGWPASRGKALSDLLRKLEPAQKEIVTDQVLDAACNFKTDGDRAEAIAAIVPELSQKSLNRALEASLSLREESARARAISATIPRLRAGRAKLLDEAARAARATQPSDTQRTGHSRVRRVAFAVR